MNDSEFNFKYERERLQALRSYHILDTDPESCFDHITALASQILDVPVAIITFIDEHRIWFKSKQGINLDHIERSPGLCANAIHDPTPYIITDAINDPRCSENPLVAKESGVRFYAGIRLLSKNNFGLGTLCILDFKPRAFSKHEADILKSLADIVMVQLEMRLAIKHSHEIAEVDNRFRLLFEQTTDAMLLLDPDTGYFIDWNPAAMHMLRYPQKQPPVRLTPIDISPEFQPDGRRSDEKAIEMNQLALDNGSHRFEWTICSEYRDAFPIEVLLTTLAINDKQMFIVTWRDLSEMKVAEKELHESRIRWQFALEGSGDGVWDWNIQDGTVYFSKRWKEMLGYRDEEIGCGLNEWSDRVHPDDIESVMHDVKVHFEGKESSYLNEHRVRCKDGSYKWILDRGKIVSYNNAGEPNRMVGTHTDISEQKLAMQTLAETEASQRALLTAMADGVFVAQDYRFVFCNPALPKMLGYTQEEFVGKEFKEVIDEEFLGL